MTDEEAANRLGPDERYGFHLDAFQLEAIAALDRGHSVLVAAPTGAGKTVVAEHAVRLALSQGRRVFYTTPIKALSNQKFADLGRLHGTDRVGLLTGDNSINGGAPVVVMTTEVLRNMIYGGSSALDDLGWVVLDEVHYLQDAYRGPVWEEVIIHAPAHVELVCLSATVSNAEELADWIGTVRGTIEVVVETTRPVELVNLYMVGDRSSEAAHLVPTLVDGRPNREGERFDIEPSRPRRGRPRRRFSTPRRVEVIDELHDRGLLPAIYFIFSRAACDDSVRVCKSAGLTLTEPAEREEIRRIVEAHTARLDDADLDVLGYAEWLAGLEAGVASHHAGMVPPFKEAVEACFVRGLLKAVFATETLALGINMPARSVVIEKLSKFRGDHHEPLTPAEYTQLTGRAGRRGIDEVGHAVVLWSPFTTFGEVAGLAASRSFELRSAFRPTYNMAANLVRRYDAPVARQLLNQSFAQYQADREVVRLESRLEKRRGDLRVARERAASSFGDIGRYAELRREALETKARRTARPGTVEAVAELGPGDVIEVRGERLVVLSVAYRRARPRTRAINAGGDVVDLHVDDFDQPPEAVGEVELPQPYSPNNRRYRHEVARNLTRARLRPRRNTHGRGDEPDPFEVLAADPVAADPQLDERLRAHNHSERIAREVADLDRRIRGRTETLARRFDRVLEVLEQWRHVDGWELTERGEILARCYHEGDLLVAEALCRGHLDGLGPPELAGLVSCFVYEHRSRTPPAEPWFPTAAGSERFAAIDALAGELRRLEEARRLPLTRRPDGGFSAIAHAWAAGLDLDDVLAGEELSGGDFVRTTKALIDLLRQIAELAPEPATARAAREATDALRRGVIAAGSDVDRVDELDDSAAGVGDGDPTGS